MTELFSKFDYGQFIGLVVVIGGLLCGLVAIIGGLVVKYACHAREIALKEDMISRGMSADDIRTVIASSPASFEDHSRRS